MKSSMGEQSRSSKLITQGFTDVMNQRVADLAKDTIENSRIRRDLLHAMVRVVLVKLDRTDVSIDITYGPDLSGEEIIRYKVEIISKSDEDLPKSLGHTILELLSKIYYFIPDENYGAVHSANKVKLYIYDYIANLGALVLPDAEN